MVPPVAHDHLLTRATMTCPYTSELLPSHQPFNPRATQKRETQQSALEHLFSDEVGLNVGIC
eukprot:633156-Amphidinium_carterae.1